MATPTELPRPIAPAGRFWSRASSEFVSRVTYGRSAIIEDCEALTERRRGAPFAEGFCWPLDLGWQAEDVATRRKYLSFFLCDWLTSGLS